MNDLISRQALCEYALNQKYKSVTPNDIMRFPSAQPERKKGRWIEDGKGFYMCSEDEKGITVSRANVDSMLKYLPPAQPKQRTGKWTLGFDNRYMEKYYYCSCCGGRKYGEYEPLDYFCSNCGADMRGEQDGH